MNSSHSQVAPSAGAGADQTKNGLAPGKLSVIVEKGTGLKNFAKELHKIEDDKTLWVMAILTTVFYFLLSGIVYTNVEPIVPGGDAVPCPDGSWCLDSSGAGHGLFGATKPSKTPLPLKKYAFC